MQVCKVLENGQQYGKCTKYSAINQQVISQPAPSIPLFQGCTLNNCIIQVTPYKEQPAQDIPEDFSDINIKELENF